MKTFFLVCIIIGGSFGLSSGQKLDTFRYNDRVIAPGDTFQLAKGSLNKTYAHVFIDQSKLTSNTRIGAQFDGAVVIIKQLRTDKVNKREIVTATLLGLEPFKVKCNLKEALDSREMVQYKKTK